jgi:uncharacterized lipoprotein YehR (DUF1307 family)
MKITMKLLSVLIAASMVIALSSATNMQQPNPIGNWKVVSDYAPEGFQTSKVTISKEEDNFLVEMNFEEIGYKIKGEKVSFTDGIFKFNLYVEGEDVIITMKFNGEDKLVGTASTSGGEIPLEANRIKQ